MPGLFDTGLGFSTDFNDISTGLFGGDISQSGSSSTEQQSQSDATNEQTSSGSSRGISTTRNTNVSSVDKNIANTKKAASVGSQIGTEVVRVDRAAIDKIIGDILSSNEGLAEIFTEEQDLGLFNSTVGQDAAGDLVAKISGEIAKLTGVKETDLRLAESLSEAGGTTETGTSEDTSTGRTSEQVSSNELTRQIQNLITSGSSNTTSKTKNESDGLLDAVGLGGLF